MLRFYLLACLSMLGATASLSRPQSSLLPSTQTPSPGTLVEHLTCSRHPEQSYAVYLPSSYSQNRSWPIVYSFDPAARGKLPVGLQKEAAERYGYILAASNNSRNGPWKPEAEAAEAMMEDTQTRFSIDQRQIYFAGFSGGARLVSQLATLCKCAAGVFLTGAGFSSGKDPSKDISFAVFTAVGTLDFNYREVIPLQSKLAAAGYPHWLRIFDGPHEWAPPQTMDEALAWFRVLAIKSKLAPADGIFLEDQFAKSKARADSFLKLQDTLNAYREYSQIASTYDGLLDVSTIRTNSAALAKEKPLGEAMRQETRDFEEQDQLTTGISSALSAASASAATDASPGTSVEDQVRRLRERAEQEKRPPKAMVLKRALSGVFIEAMELGNDALDRKNFQLAIRAYSSAIQASPKSEWAWESLAVAQASSGARKEALNALKRARGLAEDKSHFFNWLQHEPSFDRYRSTPEFQSLQEPD